MDFLAYAVVAWTGICIIILVVGERRVSKLREELAGREEKVIAQEGNIEAMAGDISWLRGHLEGAHQTIVDLKREGFERPSPTPALLEVGEGDPLPHEATDAIDRLGFKPSDPIYGTLLAEARVLHDGGLDPAAIAERITQGSDYTPYEV